MNKKIIFSGGGTGGHIFPAINLMKHFFDKGYKVILITDTRGQKFIKNFKEFKSYVLMTGTPTNKNLIKKFFSLILIFYSIIKSIIILIKEKPNLIIGFGGYVSFPVSFSSKLFNLPLIIYENNMVLGRANKYLLPFAKKIFLAKDIVKNISKNYRIKAYEVGSILDKSIIDHSLLEKKNVNSPLSILILGGSQGAKVFGEIIPPIVKKIKDAGYDVEINQQCIASQSFFLSDFYEKNKIKSNVFEFDKNILKNILSSDLAITRCGASTTAELAHTATPFIAIPLPNSIDDHQQLNAKYYENKGYCWFLEQDNFIEENLFKLIMEIIKNKNKLENIRENMKKNHKKDVYSNIENVIKEFI